MKAVRIAAEALAFIVKALLLARGFCVAFGGNCIT